MQQILIVCLSITVGTYLPIGMSIYFYDFLVITLQTWHGQYYPLLQVKGLTYVKRTLEDRHRGHLYTSTGITTMSNSQINMYGTQQICRCDMLL